MQSLSWAILVLAASRTRRGEDALVVGRVHEAGRGRAELRLERPDLHGVTALTGGDVQTCHAATVCQYAWFACSGSGRTEPRENGKQNGAHSL